MPRGRFLNKKIVDDYRLNKVPVEAELLFYKMVTHLDCEGRLQADPKLINNKFYALRNFTNEEVDEWLDALWGQKKNGVGLIERYEIEGNQYLWMPGFEGEQGKSWHKERESPSEIPPPPGQKEPKLSKAKPIKTEDIIDPKLAGIVKSYEENIGMLTPALFERLKDDFTEYGAESVKKAIEEAVLYNKRNLKYIEAILERWKVEGIEALPLNKGKYARVKNTEIESGKIKGLTVEK